MTGGAVLKAASAGAARRLVQTAVVFVVAAAAAASGVLGLTIATSSTLAYHQARAKDHGPDLTMTVNLAKVTSARLAAAGHLPGVTQAAGFPATTIGIAVPVPKYMSARGRAAGPVTVVGRVSRAGPLDDIGQQSGRWPSRKGEIDLASYAYARGAIGQVVTAAVTSVRGSPKLLVAGYASPPTSGDVTQQAWVVPAELSALEKAGAPAQEEMAYTFRDAATPAQISADLRELRAALPAGAVVSYTSWLDTEYFWEAAGGSSTPFLIAYAVVALALALLITVIVAAAAVAAGYRRIGVLKSIGFTPAQVTVTYLVQLGVPALAGALAGTVIGSRWAHPLIRTDIPAWIQVSVTAGLCVLSGLAILAPAVRAGRLNSVQAITAGQAPSARHWLSADRLASRIRLPRPVSLGLAAPLTRPSRLAATFAVIAAGLAAVVLAAGLDAQMHQIVMVPGWADNGVRLVRQLTRLVTVLAALGVFSAALMLARERVRELGICKAVGMTPHGVITMVTCWVIPPAIAAAVVALPAGIAGEHLVARAVVSWQASRMANVHPLAGGAPSLPRTTNSGSPRPGASRRTLAPGNRPPRRAITYFPRAGGHSPHPAVINLPRHGAEGSLPPQLAQLGIHLAQGYTPGALALLVLAGLAIAIAGALGPAIWAAATKTITTLQSE